SKETLGHINVQAFYRSAYAGTVRVPADTEYLNMVTGWKVPIVQVSQSPLMFAVFIKPHHNIQHPSMW
ncbi:hypothetical protein ACUODJ_26765, partial [Escherichia sp. HC-CC]